MFSISFSYDLISNFIEKKTDYGRVLGSDGFYGHSEVELISGLIWVI